MSQVNVLVIEPNQEPLIRTYDDTELTDLYGHFSTQHHALAYLTLNTTGNLALVEQSNYITLEDATEQEVDYFKSLETIGTKNFKISKVKLVNGVSIVLLLTHSGGTRVIDAPESVLRYFIKKHKAGNL